MESRGIDENHTPLTDEQLKFMVQTLLPILNYAGFYPTFDDIVNHLDTYSQQDILDGRSFFTDMNAFINWPDWFDDSMIRENFDQEFERTFDQEIPQWDQTIRDNFVNMFGQEILLLNEHIGFHYLSLRKYIITNISWISNITGKENLIDMNDDEINLLWDIRVESDAFSTKSS